MTETSEPDDNGFPVRVWLVEGIRQHPHADGLTMVKLRGHGREFVANKREDGSFRYEASQSLVGYLPVGAILPKPVLDEMGAWDEAKGKGTLGGSKGNRVTHRNFPHPDGGEEKYQSRGALRPCLTAPREGGGVSFYLQNEGSDGVTATLQVEEGTEIEQFLGITRQAGL